MPIQRNFNEDCDLIAKNNIFQQLESTRLDQYQQQMQQLSPRDEENINDIRRVIREQSFISTKLQTRRYRSSNSESSDEVEISVRRFTPLPDIPRADDVYFRTESKLIKNELLLETSNGPQATELNTQANYQFERIDSDEKDQCFTPTQLNEFLFDESSQKLIRKTGETRFHFVSTNSNKKMLLNQRLPAIEKKSHTFQNSTDLGEDLPMSVTTEVDSLQNQRQIYTSPADRTISPIKRPQAPSPASSAYRRKAKQQTQSDDDSS